MKRGLFLLGVVVIALGFATACSARGNQIPAFAKANQDYSEGRFQEAVDGYQSVVRSGEWSANLFYDLVLAPTIWRWSNYRRARGIKVEAVSNS